MPRQPLSYTNRQNSTAYIRAVPAKRGGTAVLHHQRPQGAGFDRGNAGGF